MIKLRKLIFIIVLIINFSIISCQSQQIEEVKAEKINGISFVASRSKITTESLEPIVNINANWVTLMPYAFTRVGQYEVSYDLQRQWRGERKEGITETIKFAQDKKLKIMLKPHLWVREQGWAGDFKFETKEEWQKWEKNYQEYILKYAKLAQDNNIEIFCLGVEIRNSIKTRNEFWLELIKEVRKVYDGKIIYAANWDNYQNVKFWNKLDYIGIDAYFPLSEKKEPTKLEIINEWEKHLKEIESLQVKIKKPLIFTEYGYRSIEYATKSPWEFNEDLKVNEENQLNAYKAILETFWDKEWFKGGFIWKWYHNHDKSGGKDNNDYTPQNKMTEIYLKDYFKKYLK